jgi:hypothetical protein
MILKHQVLRTMVFLLLCGAAAQAQPDPTLARQFEGIVKQALEALNRNDHVGFFAGWSKSMSQWTTEAVFREHYGGPLQQTLGAAGPCRLLGDRSEINPVAPVALAIFEVDFANRPKTILTIHFTKDEGQWKILQWQTDLLIRGP